MPHVGQDFRWSEPVCAGDVITTGTSLAEVRPTRTIVGWGALRPRLAHGPPPVQVVASTSTSIRGSMRPETSTIAVTGRDFPKTSPWARSTSSHCAMSVT